MYISICTNLKEVHTPRAAVKKVAACQMTAACAAKYPGAEPFAGGDIEHHPTFAAALAARAPERELVFLSVGDTRDHRRQYKDPVSAQELKPWKVCCASSCLCRRSDPQLTVGTLNNRGPLSSPVSVRLIFIHPPIELGGSKI